MLRCGATSLVLALLLRASGAAAQEPAQEKKFFEAKITKDEIYGYKDLKFTGDFTSFQSPAGNLALGRAEVGVTVVIVLGDGTLSVEAPEAVQEKFKAVFGMYPLKTKFTSLYMRLHPKEYEEFFGALALVKAPDEAALKKAQELYDQKFLGSFHAGPLAILPRAIFPHAHPPTVSLYRPGSNRGIGRRLSRSLSAARAVRTLSPRFRRVLVGRASECLGSKSLRS